MKVYYCGIGSRETPINVQEQMTNVASRLEKVGFILRSGGARGADRAFEKGVVNSNNKEIFYAKDAENWCFQEVKKFLPNDRSGFDYWKPYVKNLLARNMMQILGKSPSCCKVRFVVCWTPNENYSTSDVGGTGYAIRCALNYNIPIYNFVNKEQIENFEQILKELEK